MPLSTKDANQNILDAGFEPGTVAHLARGLDRTQTRRITVSLGQFVTETGYADLLDFMSESHDAVQNIFEILNSRGAAIPDTIDALGHFASEDSLRTIRARLRGERFYRLLVNNSIDIPSLVNAIESDTARFAEICTHLTVEDICTAFEANATNAGAAIDTLHAQVMEDQARPAAAAPSVATMSARVRGLIDQIEFAALTNSQGITVGQVRATIETNWQLVARIQSAGLGARNISNILDGAATSEMQLEAALLALEEFTASDGFERVVELFNNGHTSGAISRVALSLRGAKEKLPDAAAALTILATRDEFAEIRTALTAEDWYTIFKRKGSRIPGMVTAIGRHREAFREIGEGLDAQVISNAFHRIPPSGSVERYEETIHTLHAQVTRPTPVADAPQPSGPEETVIENPAQLRNRLAGRPVSTPAPSPPQPAPPPASASAGSGSKAPTPPRTASPGPGSPNRDWSFDPEADPTFSIAPSTTIPSGTRVGHSPGSNKESPQETSPYEEGPYEPEDFVAGLRRRDFGTEPPYEPEPWVENLTRRHGPPEEEYMEEEWVEKLRERARNRKAPREKDPPPDKER